jgi:hypothetical protein
MVRLFTALFSVLILASMLYAQSAPEAPAGYRAELQKGTSFTGFHWTPGVGDFGGKEAAIISNLDYYTGESNSMETSLYGIEYGYFISTAWSISGVVDFGSTSTEQDITGGTGQIKNDMTEFGINVFVRRYFQPKFQDVAAWIGAGVTFGSLSATREDTGVTPEKDEFSATSFGVTLDFGAQYFIAEGFALTGNYYLGFLTLSKPELTHTEDNVSTTVNGTSATMFGTMTGSLGISFYF